MRPGLKYAKIEIPMYSAISASDTKSAGLPFNISTVNKNRKKQRATAYRLCIRPTRKKLHREEYHKKIDTMVMSEPI
ncbi:MAG: hypothetical protein L6V93_04720 [Clostridiales bacterium]|nr:MAG: hypothetical protein L6V93_04720 [Clostridiales bacterium]